MRVRGGSETLPGFTLLAGTGISFVPSSHFPLAPVGRALAADLAQDTFMHAWAAAPDLAVIAQPRAWLYRIATHVALDAVRHRRHIE